MTSLKQGTILTMNRGSGTLKATLYEVKDEPALVLSIAVERAGTSAARVKIVSATSGTLCDRAIESREENADLTAIFDWLSERGYAGQLIAAGHRLVYGGAHYTEPQRIGPELLTELKELARLDPDHMPEAIRGIRFIAQRFPKLPQVASFDTAFHASLPKVARMYALPRGMYDEGIRRYGFHGISCEYILQELRSTDGARAQGRVIVAHLGNGASMTAVRNGRSVDTSMGFTPLEGLVMGTRSGDIDPAAVLYIQEQRKISPEETSSLLNRESGLLGVSGISADMRDLLQKEAGDSCAAEAVELFCYRAKKYLGAYTAALGGLDVLVFSGGIGENAPEIRERICAGLEFLGIELDAALNRTNAGLISSSHSRVRVRVIQTDEDWMIAQHVLAVLRGTKS
ncbi:MAG: acetate/propionate family kinase [Candidatus Acidiferrales bacterium]